MKFTPFGGEVSNFTIHPWGEVSNFTISYIELISLHRKDNILLGCYATHI